MKSLAIIPARSGSKGLPDKNIKMLNDRPLISYSIESAIRSNCFETVFVSTDSELYADISKQHGAEVPFLRSKCTADDSSSTWDVVQETLTNFSKLGKFYDSFMILQPTSPLRTEMDITSAFEVMKSKNAKAVISVCLTDHSPLWCNTLPQDNNLSSFINKGALGKRRQELPNFYRLNGAIYLISTDYFKTSRDFYSDNCYAFIMDKKHSIDIDDIYDFTFAESVMKTENTTSNR